MIRKTRSGEFIGTCSECGDDEELDGDNFQEAVESMKDRGWKVFKRLGAWIHVCAGCGE